MLVSLQHLALVNLHLVHQKALPLTLLLLRSTVAAREEVSKFKFSELEQTLEGMFPPRRLLSAASSLRFLRNSGTKDLIGKINRRLFI